MQDTNRMHNIYKSSKEKKINIAEKIYSRTQMQRSKMEKGLDLNPTF